MDNNLVSSHIGNLGSRENILKAKLEILEGNENATVIINNDNEKYSCWINFDIPLDDIYEGTTMKAKSTNSQKYVFFRE